MVTNHTSPAAASPCPARPGPGRAGQSVVRPDSALACLAAGQYYLERGAGLGVGENVVGLLEVVQVEVVGDELGGVELPGGDQPHQGRGGGAVHLPGGDGDVPGPLLFQVQHGRTAVHADVG